MELKDVILSTLAEMEESPPIKKQQTTQTLKEKSPQIIKEVTTPISPNITQKNRSTTTDNELLYLISIRERLLVLFEGFQAPNNTNIEAKVDMTLNFLEYVLATIDSRVETINKGSKSESI